MFPKLMQLEREPSINPVCICLPLQLCVENHGPSTTDGRESSGVVAAYFIEQPKIEKLKHVGWFELGGTIDIWIWNVDQIEEYVHQKS